MSITHSKVKNSRPPQPRVHQPVSLICGTALLMLLCIVGCRTAPLQRVVDVPYPAASEQETSAAVDEAIWRAGRKIGWSIEGVGSGDLKGIWRLRTYEAVVSIRYGNERLRITYESSRNLLHDGDRIHRHYNQWVAALATQILQEPVPSRGTPPRESGAGR